MKKSIAPKTSLKLVTRRHVNRPKQPKFQGHSRSFVVLAVMTMVIFVGMLVDTVHGLLIPMQSSAQTPCEIEISHPTWVSGTVSYQDIPITLPTCMTGAVTVTVTGYEGHENEACTNNSPWGLECQGRESGRISILFPSSVVQDIGEYIDQGKTYRTFSLSMAAVNAVPGTAHIIIRYTAKPYNGDQSISNVSSSVNFETFTITKDVSAPTPSALPTSTPVSTLSPTPTPDLSTPSATPTPIPTMLPYVFAGAQCQ